MSSCIHIIRGSKVKCRARISLEDFQDYIHFGIKNVIEDFENLSNQLTDGGTHPEELQITIFSMKKLSKTLNYIQTALPLFKVQHLFKILIVELIENDLDLDNRRKDQCSSSFLEYLQVNGTVERLTELMKHWLTCGDVQQHVKLIVQGLTIECDARDCILRPPSPSPCDMTQEGSDEEAVEVLEVIKRLPTEGICETQMFGDPVLLMPCQWQNHLYPAGQNILPLNAQYFLELCNKLGMSDEYLVAKFEKISGPVRFILLMPGERFLLAKELVSAEMAFPFSISPNRLGIFTPPEIESRVTTSLVNLPSISSYNPSDFSSGLYKNLLRKIQHSFKKESKQEPLRSDPVYETIVVGIEVQKKSKLRKRRSVGRRVRYNTNELPLLTDTDQQTLAQCFSKQNKKSKVTSS